MATKLDWLMEEPEAVKFEPTFKLPEGGGFQGGQIGEWHLGALYKLMIAKEIDLAALDITPDGSQAIPNANNVNYYWLPDRKADADAAAKQVGLKFGASFVWHWMMPTNTFLNFGAKDKSVSEIFGEKIEFDISIVGWGSNKHAALQLIMLPSLVQAVALKRKWIDKPVFDYNELPSDAKSEITPEIEKYYLDPTEGKLVLARQALWKALGEDNWQAYTLDDTGKFGIKAPKLRQIAQLMYRPNVEAWMKVSRILDPRAEAHTAQLDGTKKPWRTYVVLDFFWDEDEARAASGTEIVDDGLPALPEVWKGSPKADFQEQLTDFLIENKLNKLARPLLLKKLETIDLEATGATLEEILPWLDVVLAK